MPDREPTGPTPFPSLTAMRAAHARLLRDMPADGPTGEQAERVAEFLATGVATGAVLDSPADRSVAQGLLDYWSATLYTRPRATGVAATAGPPGHTLLAEFDAATVDRVSSAAEAAVAALDEADRETARRVLLTLVRLDPTDGRPTRTTATRADLDRAANPVRVQRVLDALVGAGAVRLSPDPSGGNDRVELAHEALARGWGRLKAWLDQRARFRDAARFWADHGRDRGALLGENLLADVPGPADRSQLEDEFIRASEAAVARQKDDELARLRELATANRRRIFWLYASAALLVSLLTAALIALVQYGRAHNRQEQLTSAANELAAREGEERTRLSALNTKLQEEIGSRKKAQESLLETISELNRRNTPPLVAPKIDRRDWRSALWTNGQPLRVRFLDGQQAVRDKVSQYAPQWTEGTGLRFVFTDDPDAEIRVSFAELQSSSVQGMEALTVPQNQPTMRLGFNRLSLPEGEFSRLTLHEFGHVLGLIHEHLNPKSGIKWNEPELIKYFRKGLPPTLTSQQILDQVKLPYPVPGYRDYDPNSIMAYSFPKEVFSAGWDPRMAEQKTNLSESDRAFARLLYPPLPPAVDLRPGPALERRLDKPRQTDRFDVTVPAGKPHRLTVKGPLDLGVVVLNPIDRLVVRFTVKPKADPVAGPDLKPGRYTVCVQPVWCDGSQTYSIGLTPAE